jgi:hypothetical protein
VTAAIAIWRRVGIDFDPTFRDIRGDDVKKLLGEDRILAGCFGTCEEETGEWQDRMRVQALKPRPDTLGIFFAKGDLGLIGSTRYDPFRHQIYISEDVRDPVIGRTVAHEVGHSLLGRGHTGGMGRGAAV